MPADCPFSFIDCPQRIHHQGADQIEARSSGAAHDHIHSTKEDVLQVLGRRGARGRCSCSSKYFVYVVQIHSPRFFDGVIDAHARCIYIAFNVPRGSCLRHPSMVAHIYSQYVGRHAVLVTVECSHFDTPPKRGVFRPSRKRT